MREQRIRSLNVIASVDPAYGGPSTNSIEIAKALRRRGYDTQLVAAGYPLGSSFSTPYATIFRPSRPYILRGSFSLFLAILRQARSVDFVHIHGQYLLPNIYAYLAARLWSKPYGVQAHGTMEPYQKDQSQRKKQIFDWLIGARIIRRASYVCFSANSEAERASPLVRPEQVVVAPLGASLEAPSEHAGINLALHGSSEVVVYLGRLAAKKRPDRLLTSWSKTQASRSGAKLVIAGPDDNFTRHDLLELAKSIGVEDSVILPGPVYGPQKSWLLAKASVFVLASANENFAIAVAEAMLAGCYCVLSSEVAASEHVVAANAGSVVLEPSDVAIAAEIDRALSDPEELKSSGLRARTYAAEHLSWDAMAKAIHDKVSEIQDRRG